MSKAATFVLAEMHRAISRKQTHVEISVKDLTEVMAEHVRVCARVDMQAEMPGQMIGWASQEKLEEMNSGKYLFTLIRRRKNEKFNLRVFLAKQPTEPSE